MPIKNDHELIKSLQIMRIHYSIHKSFLNYLERRQYKTSVLFFYCLSARSNIRCAAHVNIIQYDVS
jgi:hypothetical protein